MLLDSDVEHQATSLIAELQHGRAQQTHGSPELVSIGEIEIDGDYRRTVFLHPPASITVEVPEGCSWVSFGVALSPDVWDEPEGGACEFLVEADGDVLERITIDPLMNPAHRRWHDMAVPIPSNASQPTLVTFRTVGIGGDSYRWALLGEPRFTRGPSKPTQLTSAPPAMLRASFQRLATHPENLSFNLYRELMYWNNELRAGNNPYIRERLNQETLGRGACPDFLVDLVQAESHRLQRKPQVLDFGAGPFSTLVFLERAAMATLTTADALAEEFDELRRAHGIDFPLRAVHATGEHLTETLSEHAFDIVNVTNALDHTQAPALSWLNLFKVTRPGGLIVHKHIEREATYENFDQLHQFDLFPEDSSLWITDASGASFSLTDDLPLTCVHHERRTIDGRDWFWAAYRKDSEAVNAPAFLHHVVNQMTQALKKRSRWAFEVEHFLNSSIDLRHHFNGLPYTVSMDRA